MAEVRKSLEKWFNELPEPMSLRAKANTPHYRMEKETSSLAAALMIAFIWGKTKEGYKYWEDLYTEVQFNEFKKQQVKQF